MKQTLQATILSLLSFSAFGQVTINGSDINPSVGDSYTDNSANYLAPGNAGANQTWDFSTISSTGTSSISISASTTNGANMVYTTSSATAHYNISSVAQEIKEIFANSITITYTNGEKIMQFPLVYNSSYSDTFRATFMSGIYPAVRAGANTLMVDGYGTLIMPTQTVTDVIRVRLQQNYADTIDIGTPYIIPYVSDVYVWYKAGFKSPIMSISSLDASGNVTAYANYTTSTSVSIDEIDGVEELTILGNPFTDNLRFSIRTNSNVDIEYQLVDLSGSIVYTTNSTSLTNGDNVLTIPTSNLSAGLYALKITSGNSAISKLVVRE